MQCNKPEQMVEIVEGTLMYDNLKSGSWITENMEYEKVQDKRIREAFEIDLQESKVRNRRNVLSVLT